MSNHLFFALTNPVQGREAEFTEWYDRHHLSEVLAIPGFVTAQRYELSPKQRAGESPLWRYLALYEFGGDIDRIHETVHENRHRMTLSDACAPDHAAWVYSPIGPKRSSADAADRRDSHNEGR